MNQSIKCTKDKGQCYRHEIEKESQTKDSYERFFDKLVLTEDEEEQVIRHYGQLEKSIHTKDDCAIGVGYTTCMDIGFRAVDLFEKLQPQIKQMLNQGGPIQPQVHAQITELREFTETFLYYFSQGANAERVSDSKDVFYLFYETIKQQGISHKDELGGHSSVFAVRAQKEHCKVFVAAQTSDFNLASIPLSSDNNPYLVWPNQKNHDPSTVSEKEKRKYDIHLVFEYNEGDVILGFKAPRSNRFYFVHDPNGAKFKQMEQYHEQIYMYPNIKRHMFGGYQLMQKLEINEAEQRLKKLDELWRTMKARDDHRIHVEFAHFSRLDFFKLFEHYVVRNADSLGMNEQELIMLLDFWNHQLDDINAARESKPDLEETLAQLKEFFAIVKEQRLPISRVHMHPYGSFILCYDHNKWEDGFESIIKSSLTTPKYCMMAEDLSDHVENYDIPERPYQFANPQNFGEIIKVEKDNLTYSFNLNDDIRCYLQFFMKCRKMVKTAGMGDTISSTGFIYQAPNVYEPRGTFTAVSNDYLSRTQYRGGANHTTHYHTNGTGRDSYIVRDNGGFCKMHEPCKYPALGTFNGKRIYRDTAPAIHAKNIYYRSDGTGRDSYVVSTSGGFNNIGKVVEYRQAFVNSLRQYDRPQSAYQKLGGMTGGLRRTASSTTFKHQAQAQEELKKRDYLLESQLSFNWKYHESQKQLRSSQKFMDERLAQPKRTRSKMPLSSKTIEY